MKRCTRCLYPSTKPDLVFDAQGVCSACTSYDKRKTIDWQAREKALLELLDRHHGECVVASSGGKDSTWIALKLLELGAHVTAVTATTCQLTDIGHRNIRNLARYVPTIEVTPNLTVRAKLNRLGLKLVGDISHAEHMAIFSIPFRVATDLGIGLAFFGECPQAHYGGPNGTDAAYELTPRWRSEFGGFLGLRPSDLVGMDGITARDMELYTLPAAGTAKAYFLGQFLPWDSHRNAEVASRHGMEQVMPSAANWWIHENLDNVTTGLHCHGMYRKFGYGRAAAQLSVDVRSGLIDRDYAMGIAKERDGLFPWTYMGVKFSDTCKHIGMTEEEVMSALDEFTTWSLFDRVDNGRPILKEFA